jgi:Putative zinc-finger
MSPNNKSVQPGPHRRAEVELYALGVLTPAERRDVEAHVGRCERCTRLLLAADSAVAAMDDEFVPQIDPPDGLRARLSASALAAAGRPPERRTHWPLQRLAMAASLVFGIVAGGSALVERSGDAQQAARDSSILETIASSHFLHVSLTARTEDVPKAKVLYAPDGSWMYVVIDSATCACHVIVRSARTRRDLGLPEARGKTSVVFTRAIGRVRDVALVDSTGKVIADATLDYAN